LITVLFLGPLADRLGFSKKEWVFAGTPRELVQREMEGPFMKDRSLRVAVNRRWAHWDTPLTEGDEVAFLPPVSSL